MVLLHLTRAKISQSLHSATIDSNTEPSLDITVIRTMLAPLYCKTLEEVMDFLLWKVLILSNINCHEVIQLPWKCCSIVPANITHYFIFKYFKQLQNMISLISSVNLYEVEMCPCLHVCMSCQMSAVCSMQWPACMTLQEPGLQAVPLSPNSVDNIYQSVILNCLFSGLRRAVSKLLTSSVKFVRYFLQDNER